MRKDSCSSSSRSASDQFRFGTSAALAIGFGLHNAWICAVMYSTHAVYDIASFTLPGVQDVSLSLIYFISIAAFCLLMFIAAGFDQKLLAVSRSRRTMFIAAALTCIGTLMPLAASSNPTLALIIECTSGVLTGIGSATLLLYWGIAFSRERTPIIAITGSVAVTLGFALSTLFLQVIPAPFSGIISSVIPLLEFLILRAISPQPPTPKHLHFNALPTSKIRMGMILVSPLALIGFALGILKQTSVLTTLEGVLTPTTLIVLFLAGSLTISLFTLQTYLQKPPTWDHFFRIIIPAFACAALLISLLCFDATELSDLFLLVAYIFIETLVLVQYAHLAHKFHLSPIFLLGLSRGMMAFFMLIGSIVALYVDPWPYATNLEDAILITIPLALIPLGYALMPRETDLAQRIAQCPAVRFAALELDEDLGLLKSISPDTISRPAETTEQAARPDTPPAGEQPHTPLDPSASKTLKAMPPKSEHDNKAPRGKFSRKVKKVAELYLLTERETDILFELAKGNSPVYIQEKYFISAGTVKTHMRNVYRKLNIHKRNDLLRLIESIEEHD